MNPYKRKMIFVENRISRLKIDLIVEEDELEVSFIKEELRNLDKEFKYLKKKYEESLKED